MYLEDQCCNEMQGEKLKKLGVKQESLFYHTYSEKWGVMPKKSIDFSGSPTSAFTVAELGVMIPSPITHKNANYIITSMPSAQGDIFPSSKWTSRMENKGNGLWCKGFGETEAIARANMLIHLLENKIASIDEVNIRLMA